MLVIAALAVLLAGDTPASQAGVTPPSTPTLNARPSTPKLPLVLDLGVGWTQVTRVDPYGRFGPTSFTAGMPLFGASLRGQTWYAEMAGQMMWTSLTNRNTTATVGRELFSSGRVRWDVSAEFADVRFRREDFRTSDVLIGTSRSAMTGLLGLGIGLGPYHGASARLSALGGWYHNRYGTVAEFPALTEDAPITQDDNVIIGARVEVSGIELGPLELGGTARYLRLSGSRPTVLPDDEVSGTATLNIRLFRIRGKQLFVGGFARFGPAGPSLITDKTFGLRGIWRLK